MNKVLIVIDAQEDFTRGALRNEEAIKALPVIREIVDYAYVNFDRAVIYTKDIHKNGSYLNTQEGKNLPVPHCIAGTKGVQICHEALVDEARVYEKSKFAIQNWDIAALGAVDEIWMCGFCTDICVSANFQTLKACYPEVPIVVIEDACAGVTPELHEAALKVMKSCQARVVKWNELNGKAQEPESETEQEMVSKQKKHVTVYDTQEKIPPKCRACIHLKKMQVNVLMDSYECAKGQMLSLGPCLWYEEATKSMKL